MSKVTLVYDGQCPLCRNYAKRVRLEGNAAVELVDAREQSSLRRQLTEQGCDLDRGMAVQIGDSFYFGPEALNVLARRGRRTGVLNRIWVYLFRSRRVSFLIYPLLRGFRNLVLWVMDVPQIKNLKEGDRHE